MEGEEGTDEWDVLIADIGELKLKDDDSNNSTPEPYEQDFMFTTHLGSFNGYEAVAALHNQSAGRAITSHLDISNEKKGIPNTMMYFPELQSSPDNASDNIVTIPSTFIAGERYSTSKFQGIVVDTGAAGVSTVGLGQFKALQRIDNRVKLDKSTAGTTSVKFGIGVASSLGTAAIDTPLGIVNFHICPVNTPFLLCLEDMDRLKTYYDNLNDVLVQEDKKRIPVIRKYGHAWITLGHFEAFISGFEEGAQSFLTEEELRQLHRRFGHPSVRRLIRVLQRSGHDFDTKFLERLTTYCHHCQLNGKSPGRFKVVLKDDYDFNFSVVRDIFHIAGVPEVLHIIDEATRFQAAAFLDNMSAEEVFLKLRKAWIDTYLGPPDVVVHDAGTNFAADKFRQNAASMGIQVNEVPIEAHNSIGLIERYHAPLRRVYTIIAKELAGSGVKKEIILQMAVKAVNDTAGPDGIVPTYLVFGAYPV